MQITFACNLLSALSSIVTLIRRHKSGGGHQEKTRGAAIYSIIKIYVVLYQVSSLSLSQSEDQKTIKGIPIDTVVVIVCVKKTDSDGLAMVAVVFVSAQCYLSTLQWSDNTRIQTLPGLLSHSDPSILINSFVFLEPIFKSFINRDYLKDSKLDFCGEIYEQMLSKQWKYQAWPVTTFIY